MNKAKN